MKNRIIRKIVFVFLLFFMYRNRYKLLNTVLQHAILRRFAVSFFMKFSIFRNKLMQMAFPLKNEST
ncbi:hypothetical protein [Fervidibacillus albus]|uniref:Uncharacterized protein n=1 Tax=Fervidibacillus albus TaxID=2980026 RepID=A0A9E8LW43_9BACI|nr:hypothetical protein [Fervidibacillus albus]WAA10415.1 hypothetical protein OE104_03535 [Fervidibacillus albus]